MRTPPKTKEQEEADRKRFMDNTARLAAIIKPLATAKHECDSDWSYIDRQLDQWKEYGEVNLNPDFQRGACVDKRTTITFH